MAVWPRARARRAYPRIRNWPAVAEVRALGFAGYKVGMSHAIVVDNRRRSPTKGEEIVMPISIVECPPLRIVGLRLYGRGEGYGMTSLGERWATEGFPDLGRKLPLPKTVQPFEKLEAALPAAQDVRLIVATQPGLTGLGRKKPELFELGIGGPGPKEKFDWARERLGKELPVRAVLREGLQVDVHGISKGHGLQGPVRRFGVMLRPHKAEKGRRGPATLGPWHPHHGQYRVARAGQTGLHQRFQHNAWIIKLAEKPENPSGGWVHYGELRNAWLCLKGSLPGPAKRLVILTEASRPAAGLPVEPPQIVSISMRSKQ